MWLLDTKQDLKESSVKGAKAVKETKVGSKKDKESPQSGKIVLEDIIKDFVPIIKYLASRLSYRLPPHLDVDDLVNAGVVGLMDAVDKYDTGKNTQFRTYAEYRIRGAMLDEVRSMDWLPRSVRDKITLLEKTYLKLEKELGRPATEEEVAKSLDMDIEKLQHLVFQAKGTTLVNLEDMGGGGDDSFEIVSRVMDKKCKDPLGLVISDDIKNSLGSAIINLPEKEKAIVSLYYYDGLTMKEIGKVLEITESRVSQLHTQAVLRLRGKLGELLQGEGEAGFSGRSNMKIGRIPRRKLRK